MARVWTQHLDVVSLLVRVEKVVDAKEVSANLKSSVRSSEACERFAPITQTGKSLKEAH